MEHSERSELHKSLADMYAASHWIAGYGPEMITVRGNKIRAVASLRSGFRKDVRRVLLEWIDIEIAYAKKQLGE